MQGNGKKKRDTETKKVFNFHGAFMIIVHIKRLEVFSEAMDGLVSRSGKMLSTFEFWLELDGKTLPDLDSITNK